jgi:lipopolysaccharide/colanic/teichoic acid biosynthesis glycosyltransferase
MSNEQLKMDASTEERNGTKRGLSLLDQIPVRREDVFEERIFQAMLALERRRAERSRQSFFLVLFDSTCVATDQRIADFPEQFVSAVSGAIRESDLIGWYEGRTVLGVILTGVDDDGNSRIEEVLHDKMLQSMHESLGYDVASQLTITVHVFPERWDKGSTNRKSDVKLHPDIAAPKKRFSGMLKRVIDVVGSAIFLLIHSPVLLVVAAAIKLTSKGPVIFKQERLGQFGKSFHCLKFRTMYANNDPKIHQDYIQNFIAGKTEQKKQNGPGSPVYKITNDPRVTPVGRFLRRTSLDEFPQFWNVLRGEMSLVGPRPALLYEFEAYDIWHRRRVLDVKPGVTGLWQVFGRSRTSFDDMVRMDIRYCQRWSIWLDLKILLATPLAVLVGHGAY